MNVSMCMYLLRHSETRMTWLEKGCMGTRGSQIPSLVR